MFKTVIVILSVIIISFLNGCVGTGTLALSNNINVDILQNFDKKTDISVLHEQVIDVQDTLKLISITKNGKEYDSYFKYIHNIKPCFQGIFTEYISTKFNTIKKSNEKIKIVVTLEDYKISSRNISASGEIFSAVMGMSADIKTEYSAELTCNIKIEYKDEIFEKIFKIKENDQDLTEIRKTSVSHYNSLIGFSKSTSSSSSSTNTLDNGISNCLNNAHIRIIINIDKMINDILE